MKTEIINQDDTFRPITISITIETKEELCNMYLRHKAESCDILAYNSKFEANDEDEELYSTLKSLMEEYDLLN